jgi:hypothetical protein
MAKLGAGLNSGQKSMENERNFRACKHADRALFCDRKQRPLIQLIRDKWAQSIVHDYDNGKI